MAGVRTETHGIYMRCPTDMDDSSSASSDSLSDHSSLSVWQILPNFVEGLDIFKKVWMKIAHQYRNQFYTPPVIISDSLFVVSIEYIII